MLPVTLDIVPVFVNAADDVDDEEQVPPRCTAVIIPLLSPRGKIFLAGTNPSGGVGSVN